MARLREVLAAAHVTLMLRPPSSDSAGVMINTGPTTAQNVESYETNFFAADPFVRLAEGDVFSTEELIGPQWLQSQYYHDFLEPIGVRHLLGADIYTKDGRSEEHTSALQSLMRNSYAVSCLKTKSILLYDVTSP